jgi:HEXXH motif-containing protein
MPMASAPWRIDDGVFTEPEERKDALWLWERLSDATPDIQSHIAEGGLTTGDAHGRATLFAAAAGAIDAVPDLAGIVRTRVGHVHVLAAPPGYDISHSEPRWADRIFISVPERSGGVGALRLAESVIHEAMHLHLAEVENAAPLVKDFRSLMPSPWRAEARSIQGVLHGLFVFACIAAYFSEMLRCAAKSPVSRSYIRDRLSAIQDEIARVDMALLTAGLTPHGCKLAVSWHTQPACSKSV